MAGNHESKSKTDHQAQEINEARHRIAGFIKVQRHIII